MQSTTQTSQIVEESRPKRSILRTVSAAGPTLAGTILPTGAILWAHAENYETNEQAYVQQPPTVSRALTNPIVGEPFALIMLVGSVLLLISIVQLAVAFTKLLKDYPKADTGFNRVLVLFCIVCEVPAILGMVILSQYRGDAHRVAHDTGSYMLFFGHTFAILTCGIVVRRLLRVAGPQNDPRLAALAGQPRHAAWVAVASVAFGLAYFGNKFITSSYDFAEHLAVTITEMIVLFAFLSFLGRFWKFILASKGAEKIKPSSLP